MQITNSTDIKRLGTILSVWAHPDDETFCAGGLLAAAVRNGQTVVCVTATKGEAGTQDAEKWPLDKMADIRTNELNAALEKLGIKHHHWLDYQDGRCSEADIDKAAEQVGAIIRQYQPDTILTFGPDGLTGHPDHSAVSGWVSLAVERLDRKPEVYHVVLTVEQYQQYLQAADAKLDLFYNVDYPPVAEAAECDICLSCTNDLCDCKQAAFAVMPSQYDKMFAMFDQAYLNEAFRVEAFMRQGSYEERR